MVTTPVAPDSRSLRESFDTDEIVGYARSPSDVLRLLVYGSIAVVLLLVTRYAQDAVLGFERDLRRVVLGVRHLLRGFLVQLDLRTPVGVQQLVLHQFDVAVDRVDAIQGDHLDALDRADIDAVGAKDAAVAIDEDVELALQAALGLVESDRLGVADLGFDSGVARAETAVFQRHARHHLTANAGVVVAPDEAAASG